MNIPDEALFYVVNSETAIRDLIEALYQRPSLEVINHVLRTNPHLRGDWVQAGQMLIVTPPGQQALAMLEQHMAIAARHVDSELEKLKPRERELLARHYALLSNLASYQIARFGWAITRFDQYKKNLESQITELDALHESSGDKRSSQHESLLMQINQSIGGLLSCRLFAQGSKVRALKAKAGLQREADVHQWKTQIGPAKSIAGFKLHYSRLIKGAKILARSGQLELQLNCIARTTGQLPLFDAEGCPAQSNIDWDFDPDAYRLVIGLESAHPALLRCSIVSRDGPALFTRCYPAHRNLTVVP